MGLILIFCRTLIIIGKSSSLYAPWYRVTCHLFGELVNWGNKEAISAFNKVIFLKQASSERRAMPYSFTLARAITEEKEML